MSPETARVWLSVVALAAGTVWGCGGRVTISAAIGLAGALVLFRRRGAVRAPAVAAIAFSVGALGSLARCDLGSALSKMAFQVPSCSFEGRVLESAGGLGTLVSVDSIECDLFGRVHDAGVAVVDGAVAGPGAEVRGSGWLIPLRADSWDSARRRAGAHAYLDDSELDARPARAGPLGAAAAVRRELADATAALEPRAAGLLRGLAIGDVEGLDETTMEAFRRSGLSHLLAVSGSNVVIVLGAAAALTRALGLKLRLLAGVVALGAYVLVVGPEPSVLRAATMGGVGILALALGTRAEPLHALGVALIVLLGVRPHLVYSVGLHLSASATAGIILWSGPLSRRFGVLMPRPLSLGLGATLAAQAAVAPVLVLVFSELSIAAPVANLLAIPAVPPATVLGLLAGLVGGVHAGAGELAARAAAPFAAWILWVADRFGGRDGRPWSSRPGPVPPSGPRPRRALPWP